MAIPTVVEFKIRFPEFETVADTRIQIFVDDATVRGQVSENYFLDNYYLAVLYYTAHCLAISMRQQINSQSFNNGLVATGQAKGNLTTATIGSMSVNYSDSPLNSIGSETIADFYRTSYGVEFLKLRSQSKIYANLI